MHFGFKNKRSFVATVVLIAAILSCNIPPTAPPKSEFYVSVKGSDALGDGSKSKPWRHIQYAIDNAKPKSGTVLRIILLKGIYEENLVIHRPLEMVGMGIGKATTYPNDVNYPVEEVSIISRKDTNQPSILIENATSVNLQTLVVFGGGVRAVNTRFIMYNVEVTNSLGAYAVQIENCPMFYIEKSQIKTANKTRSDLGIEIRASSGDILNTYLGDLFDHTINIRLSDSGPLTYEDLNQPADIQYITIRDSIIEGSSIYYADGIRIQSAANVKIVNTKITRSHPDAKAANTGTPHNPPYAGIEVAGWITEAQGHALVEIEGVTISGFNIGIGMNPEGFDVKAQNNIISGIEYDVETAYTGYTSASPPVIDFGGGPLGSVGENNFAVQSPYAFYNNVPYETYACYNEWNVPVTNVDDARIFDKLDLPSKGRVNWLCAQSSIFQPTPTITRRPTMSTTERVRITRDTLCYEGPGKNYPVVSSVLQNQTANLIGIGFGNTYYVIENPIFVVPCWVEATSVEYDGDLGTLRIIAAPSTSTPTKAPDRPEPSTATPRGP